MCQCNGTRKGIGNILGVSLTVSKVGQGIPLILVNFYIVHKYFVTQSLCKQKNILPARNSHTWLFESRTLGDSTLFSTPKSIDATFPGRDNRWVGGRRWNLQPWLLMDDLMRSWGIHPSLHMYALLEVVAIQPTSIAKNGLQGILAKPVPNGKNQLP